MEFDQAAKQKCDINTFGTSVIAERSVWCSQVVYVTPQ